MVSRKLSLIILLICCSFAACSQERPVEHFRGVIYGSIKYPNKSDLAILMWIDSASGEGVAYNPPFGTEKYPMTGPGKAPGSLRFKLPNGEMACEITRVGKLITGQFFRAWPKQDGSLIRDTGIIQAVLYNPEEVKVTAFSSVQMSEESGDLIGCELVVISASGRVLPAVLCTDWGLSSFSFGYDLTGDSNHYTFIVGETTNPYRFTVTKFGNDVIVDRSLGQEPMLRDTLQLKQANVITFMQAASRH